MEHEFILKGNEVILLNEDNSTTNLEQAVSGVAMTLYANLRDLKEISDTEKREGLKKEIVFQSNALNSLSNALKAIK